MNYTVLFFFILLVGINLVCLSSLRKKKVRINSEISKKTFTNSVLLLLGVYLGVSVVYYCIFPTKIENQTQFLIVALIGALLLIYEAIFSFYDYYRTLT